MTQKSLIRDACLSKTIMNADFLGENSLRETNGPLKDPRTTQNELYSRRSPLCFHKRDFSVTDELREMGYEFEE